MIGAALLAFSAAALAAGGGGGSSGGANDDPVVVAAKAAIEKKDWAGAQAQLKQALAAKPNNADYHNLYAYSMRKGPNPDMDLVFKHYNEALRINPKHTGAHEYIGEAYLQVGDLAKAKEHLAALNKICFFGCEEYSDLKKDIAEYEASHKQ
ncbi:tetratricopeptide repeat protein [Albitalea terrae]|uniref:Tetratricopeptide repeat protein n=1 Tax=Piscinibacter terrae TaxID=2496871 RepID=A0A3N7J2W8_9BURK|nr:tetratricopeptide repeat protein [Albitalea terrae]